MTHTQQPNPLARESIVQRKKVNQSPSRESGQQENQRLSKGDQIVVNGSKGRFVLEVTS